MYRDYVNEGCEPDDDITGRCHGERCGRFCGRAYYCDRCNARIDAEYREDLAREQAWQDEKIAREQAAWDVFTSTPEYLAEMERVARAVDEADEDLPF